MSITRKRGVIASSKPIEIINAESLQNPIKSRIDTLSVEDRKQNQSNEQDDSMLHVLYTLQQKV